MSCKKIRATVTVANNATKLLLFAEKGGVIRLLFYLNKEYLYLRQHFKYIPRVVNDVVGIVCSQFAGWTESPCNTN